MLRNLWLVPNEFQRSDANQSPKMKPYLQFPSMVATVTASFAQRVRPFPPRNHHHHLTAPTCGCKSSDQLPPRCNLVFNASFFFSSLEFYFISDKPRCQLRNVHFFFHGIISKLLTFHYPSTQNGRLAALL